MDSIRSTGEIRETLPSNKIWTTVQKANDVDESKKEAGVTATEVFSQAHKVVLDANRRFSKALDHVTQCLG